MSVRTTFAVGRVNRTATEVRLVAEHPAPFAGPWCLRGVVRRPEAPSDDPGDVGSPVLTLL
jgi:hypothetical protein